MTIMSYKNTEDTRLHLGGGFEIFDGAAVVAKQGPSPLLVDVRLLLFKLCLRGNVPCETTSRGLLLRSKP